MTGDWSIVFTGIADGAGNTYWIEQETVGRLVDLVSATRDGIIRYRQRVADNPAGSAFGGVFGVVAPSSGNLIHAGAGNFVEARRLSDGGLVWRRDLVELATSGIQSSSDPLPPTLHIVGVLSGPGETIYVVFNGRPPYWSCQDYELCDAWAMSLSQRDGRLHWSRRISYPLSGRVVVDVWGSLYYLEFAGPTLVSLAPNGTERWRVDDERFGSIRMEHGSRLLVDASFSSTQDEDLNPIENACRTFALDTTTGADAFSIPVVLGQYGSPSPVASGGSFLAAVGPSNGPYCPFGEPTLLAFDLTGRVSWERSLTSTGAGFTSQPVMTNRGYLVAVGDDVPDAQSRSRLVAYSPTGDLAFSCPFPAGRVHRGSIALVGGRWLATESAWPRQVLRAYDVPAIEPAGSGWVTEGADMRKSGQDQQ